MVATAKQLSDICSLLHSRGREATPDDVRVFLQRMTDFEKARDLPVAEEWDWCEAILHGQKMATMCLHLHFGDAL